MDGGFSSKFDMFWLKRFAWVSSKCAKMFTMSPLTRLRSITNWRFIFFNGVFWTFLCHDYHDKLILSALNSTNKFMSGSERSHLEMSTTILIGVTITKLNSWDKLTVDSLINVEKKWEKLESSFLSPQLNIPTSIILLCMLCSHFPPRPLHSHSNAVHAAGLHSVSRTGAGMRENLKLLSMCRNLSHTVS